jgi:hypothetical protein
MALGFVFCAAGIMKVSNPKSEPDMGSYGALGGGGDIHMTKGPKSLSGKTGPLDFKWSISQGSLPFSPSCAGWMLFPRAVA